MKRLLFLGGQELQEVVDLLRRESPSLAFCASIAELPAALRSDHPRLVITSLVTISEVLATVQAINQISAQLPLIAITEGAVAGQEREDILNALGERGTLLAPLDLTSLRATLRSWLQPSPDPAMLDSAALARVYAKGGRALADRLVSAFLASGPLLAGKARAALHQGDPQGCIDHMENLGKQAGSLGAVDVAEAVDEILDELIEGGHVGPEQWQTLERALDSSARFLGEQNRQDRTA